MSTPKEWYDVLSKYYLIGPALFFPPYMFIDAPFGRFSPSKPSRFLVDGIKSWIVMEMVSPLLFLTAFLSSPLTRPITSLKRFPLSPPPIFSQLSFAGFRFSAPNPPTILALLFLGHYANRALISPLRTPARSKAHVAVPIAAALFNSVNGSLMGAFLAALATSAGKSGSASFWFRGNHSVVANWKFWFGVATWVIGFAGNIWHDEVLLNLRRNSKRATSKLSDGDKDKDKEGSKDAAKPHYAIPHGGLYALISYPNYFSEWIEWLGFAIAASALTAQLPSAHAVFPFAAGHIGLGAFTRLPYIQHLTPPWLFFLSEVFLMFPRAWSGHKWYHQTFPDYPRQLFYGEFFVLHSIVDGPQYPITNRHSWHS